MTARLRYIEARYDDLRKSERKVADAVFSNAEEVIHFSVSQLAERAGVSDPTVIRFCRSLGFRGFQDFKIHLAQSVVPTARAIHESAEQLSDAPDLVSKVFDANIEAIRGTLKTLDFAVVTEVIHALTNANRIIFHGLGGSAVVAMDAYHKFFRIGLPVEWQQDPHMALMSASILKANDVFVVISHSGSSRDVVKTAEIAAAAGAMVVAIVSYSKTPLAKVAHYTLQVMAEETGYRFEPMASRIAQLSVIDVLSVGVSLSRKSDFLSNLEKSRRALAFVKF